MTIIRSFLTFFCASIVAHMSLAQQVTQTVDLEPIKDNTLYERASGDRSNGAGQFIFAGLTNVGNIRRAVLAFDIVGNIPANATITDVSLTLRMTRTRAALKTVELYPVTQDWGEGTSNAPGQEGGGAGSTTNDATWIHTFFPGSTWTNAGGDFATSPSASLGVSGIGNYTWNSAQMLADVQSWFTTPATNFGWILLGEETGGRSAKRFNSREHPTVSTRPRLSVTFTVPCSAPDIPTLATSSSDFCPGDSIDLFVTSGDLGDASDWNWYAGACGGTLVGTGDTLTVTPTDTTTYYVRGEGGCVTGGDCDSLTVAPRVVTPADIPTISASQATVCAGESITLTLATGALNDAERWQWYQGGCGMDSIGEGTNISVSPMNSTTYFLRAEGGICLAPSDCGDIIIEPVDVQTDVVTDDTSLTAQAMTGSFRWLDCAADFVPIVDATQARYLPDSSGLYAVEVTQEGCSDTSDCVDFTLITTFLAETEWPASIQVIAPVGAERLEIRIRREPGPLTVSLLDLTGRVLYQDDQVGMGTVYVPWQGTGVYLLDVRRGAERWVQKVIKN